MNETEKLREDWQHAIHGDLDEYQLISKEITWTYRHSDDMFSVVKAPSGKLYGCAWRMPSKYATHSVKDMNPSPKWVEVEAKQKTITVYEPKEEL